MFEEHTQISAAQLMQFETRQLTGVIDSCYETAEKVPGLYLKQIKTLITYAKGSLSCWFCLSLVQDQQKNKHSRKITLHTSPAHFTYLKYYANQCKTPSFIPP